MLGRQREQHAGCVVLDSALAEPRLEGGRGCAVEDLVAEMLAYAREMIDPGPRPGAVLEQLVRGRIEPASRAAYVDIIARLAGAGAEAVVLGCTEIGLLVAPADSPLPAFDTTALHAASAVEWCLGAG